VKQEIEGINKETTVLLVQTDISVESDVVRLFAEVQKTFGKPAEVLLNNASVLGDGKKFAEQSVDEWWKTIVRSPLWEAIRKRSELMIISQDINTRGTAIMFHHYINTQADPQNPVGTVITVLSARAGLLIPNGSGYDTSKMAAQVLVEHIQAGT
jgi:NAD(P)-dependent dehydrogenase (short-subunit alcohol dehydrogenase family)